MDARPLVSVVVPCYNVFDYLGDCFASIATQAYENLEIVLVDDGSTDGTGELCDALAARDERAVVLHTENRGLGPARNLGIRHSHGECICFVDSDDVVSPLYVARLFGAVCDCGVDFAWLSGRIAFSDGENPVFCAEVARADNKVVSSGDFLNMLLYQDIDTAVFLGFYKRELLHGDVFGREYIAEDMVAVPIIVGRTDHVAILDNQCLYGYRLRASGIMQQRVNHRKIEGAIDASRSLVRMVALQYPEYTTAAYSRAFSLLRLVYGQALRGQLRAPIKPLYYELARYRREVLADPKARRRERLAAGIACLGRLPFSTFCTVAHAAGLMR